MVVANLEPAKLMGELSEGMLLAASDDTGLTLVNPGEISVGSREGSKTVVGTRSVRGRRLRIIVMRFLIMNVKQSRSLVVKIKKNRITIHIYPVYYYNLQI